MYSQLTNVICKAHETNFSYGRNENIKEITIHHMAGVLTASQCGQIFAREGRQASSNYGIGCDAQIGCYVYENDTSWANGNWEANCRSITIEVSNSATGGDWPVADNVFNKLVELVADIAKRNNLGLLVKGVNLTWHSMYSQTACPGPYLLSKLDELIGRANAINYAPEPTLNWTDEYHERMIADAEVKLVKVKTGETVRTYQPGSEFTFYQKCEFNGKVYYRTYYSKSHNIDNGIAAENLHEFIKEEIPELTEPDTETITEPTTSEPEPELTETEKSFCQLLLEFIKNIFTRKS